MLLPFQYRLDSGGVVLADERIELGVEVMDAHAVRVGYHRLSAAPKRRNARPECAREKNSGSEVAWMWQCRPLRRMHTSSW